MLVLFFEDKRLTTLVMIFWLMVMISIYAFSGVEHNVFLQFGPSEATYVMGFHVDTWPRWYMVSCIAFLNTCFNEFIGGSLDPWIINTIQDEKTTVLPYPKWVCMLIVQTLSIYGHIMSLFGIALLLSQIDFLVIRTVADIIVTTFAMYRFMAHKTVDSGYTRVSENKYELSDNKIVISGSEHENSTGGENRDIARGNEVHPP